MDDSTHNWIDLGQDDVPIPSGRWKRILRYCLYLFIGLSFVWLPTLYYLKTAKDLFRSDWSIILPGSGVGSSLNIDNIGQATTSVASPFTSSSVDPKVNYKAIVLSSSVLNRAALRAEIPKEEFGKPLVKLVDQTSIMQIMMEGDTAEIAHAKSIYLYEALEWKLNLLRADERNKVLDSNMIQLENYRSNVSATQAQLFDFQSSSHIASANQLELALQNISALRTRRSELMLRLASNSGRNIALSGSTGLSSSRSDDVITLQQDSTLSELQLAYNRQLKEYLETSATLGDRNPKVASLSSKIESLSDAIANRASNLLGYRDESFVNRYLPIQNPESGVIYRDQRSVGLEILADQGELLEIESMISSLELGLAPSSRTVAKLEELERAYKVAETIYLSALAKQDLGRSDVFASYPMTQMLVQPELPQKPEKLHRLFTVIGAAVGSFFVVLSLVISWKRASLLLKLLKKK